MIEELNYINHWLNSKDAYFNRKYGVDRSYFVALQDVVHWVESFRDDMKGHLPSPETVASQFEDFKILTHLDPIDYAVNFLREQKAYMTYRPILTTNAQMVSEGQTLEAMWQMRNQLDSVLKMFTGNITRYDWVQNSMDRYEKYMETHGKEGLSGLTTGLKSLDLLTGGWKEDDLILVAGRTNEGKSLIGLFFTYMVWRSLKMAGITDPVIYLTTEMPKLELAYRLDTLRGHFSNRSLNDGRLQDVELYREFLEELKGAGNSLLILDHDDNRGNAFTPIDIRAIFESEKPAFACIDQLYDISDGTGEREIRKRIVNVSNDIRKVNLETLTPTMLIAQAGRDSAKDARKDPNASPEVHQIQESDNPAQKATRVITIRRIDDIFKLSLKKNRSGKKDVDVFLRSEIDTGIYEETTEQEMVF